MKKHGIPLETSVTFEDDSHVYKVASYQELLGPCGPDCAWDHDCYEEPYITVRQETWKAFPLSKLRLIFGEDHYGRPPTPAELGEPIETDIKFDEAVSSGSGGSGGF